MDSDPGLTSGEMLEILQTLHRYPHAVDDRDWSAFARVFTADIVCDMRAVGLGLVRGRDALVDLFDTIEHPVAHHLVDPVVDPTPDGAAVRSKWLVVLADRTTLSGCYADDVVRTADGWRIQRRTITRRQEGSRRPVPAYD